VIVGDGDIHVLKEVKHEATRPGEGSSSRLQLEYKTYGNSIKDVINLGEDYIYAMTEGFHEESKKASGEKMQGQWMQPGFYVFDGYQLMKNKVDPHILIRGSLSGVNS